MPRGDVSFDRLSSRIRMRQRRPQLTSESSIARNDRLFIPHPLHGGLEQCAPSLLSLRHERHSPQMAGIVLHMLTEADTCRTLVLPKL